MSVLVVRISIIIISIIIMTMISCITIISSSSSM